MTDQAETLLMRLMRGSGLSGMTGIYPAVEGMIIRPLIQLEGEEIEFYLKEKNIPYRIDESNFDRRFLRNRIRGELIPFIKKNFEPQIVAQLGKLASIWQEEEALLEKIAEEKAQAAILNRKKAQVSLTLDYLASLPLALQRRVVRKFIQKLKGDLRGISFKDIESVLSLGERKECQLKKNLVLHRERGMIYLKTKSLPEIKYEYSWNGQNKIEIKEIGLVFAGNELAMKEMFSFDFDDRLYAYLDRSKIKEIMRAKQIPLSQRDKHPVFLSEGEIVWVYGLPVSDRYKVRQETERVFIIKKL